MVFGEEDKKCEMFTDQIAEEKIFLHQLLNTTNMSCVIKVEIDSEEF